jgi:hypothetical protein
MSALTHAIAILPTDPTGAGGSFINFEGQSVAGTISSTAHVWIDDSNGLFHTTTDLNVEWAADYAALIAHHGAGLTPEQHLEADAQAVFLNTGLGSLPMSQQAVIREDVQREIDAIGAAQQINQALYSTNPDAPLTALTYLQLGQTLQDHPQLEELAVQGHGLNNPPLPRYSGYTNDAQNVVDNTTLYIGPGPDHGQTAVPNFVDDAIMSHLPFPVVERNGHLIQLNQNGQKESSIGAAVNNLNLTLFGPVLTAKDFKG